MNIGQAIRLLRQKRDMTQTELAERVGMSVNAVSSWELGKSFPPNGSLQRICDAFGITEPQLQLTAVDESQLPMETRDLYRYLRERLLEDVQR